MAGWRGGGGGLGGALSIISVKKKSDRTKTPFYRAALLQGFSLVPRL